MFIVLGERSPEGLESLAWVEAGKAARQHTPAMCRSVLDRFASWPQAQSFPDLVEGQHHQEARSSSFYRNRQSQHR
jgi:hypothetical protein